jgi:hypothetical protein
MNETTIKYLKDNFTPNTTSNTNTNTITITKNDKINMCLKFFDLTRNNFNSKTLRSRYFDKCKLYHPDKNKNKSDPSFTDDLFKISYDVNKFLENVLHSLSKKKGKNGLINKRINVFESFFNSPKIKKFTTNIFDLDNDNDDDNDNDNDDDSDDDDVVVTKKKTKVEKDEKDDDEEDEEEYNDLNDITCMGKIPYILKDLDRHSIQTFLNEHKVFANIKDDPLIDCICSQRYNTTRRVRYNPTISVKKEVDISILYSLSPSEPAKRTFDISISRQDIRYTSGTSITYNNFVMHIIFPLFIKVHPPYFLILKQRGHQNVNSEDESDFYADESPFSSETIDLSKSTILSTNLFVVDPPKCNHMSSSSSTSPSNIVRCKNCVSRHDVFVAIVPKLPPFYQYDLSSKILSCEITSNLKSELIQDIFDPSIHYEVSKSCLLKGKGLLSMANPSKRLDLRVVFTNNNDKEPATQDDIIKKMFT